MPTRFRKRPVVIEAILYCLENRDECIEWVGESCDHTIMDDDGCEAEALLLTIHTLEGGMKVAPGDWIIRGVAGEFYPCKNDIFIKTYERADI